MVLYGAKDPKKISISLNIPLWWIQSVAIEYLPCRKFAQYGKLWIFDFRPIADNLSKSIDDLHVVIPEYYIIQNVRPEDIGYRAAALMVGDYALPLKDANAIPEGLCNTSRFTFGGNPIDTWDPKLGFNTHAVIRDDGLFYQWKIADSYNVKSKESWFKSKLFDLIPLYDIANKLARYIGSEELKNNPREFKFKVAELYKKLENARVPIRNKIWEYHLDKKAAYRTRDTNVPEPPVAGLNESIRLINGRYQIISYMEPLFYRSANRNFQLANKSRSNQKKRNLTHDAILEEMEYSAISIICSVTCLESYINGIIRDCLPHRLPLLDRSLEDKWLTVMNPNCSNKFNRNKDPFKSFIRLVRLRDKAIHYKIEYRNATPKRKGDTLDLVSFTYNNFNRDNAKFALRLVRQMVTELCKVKSIVKPIWLDNVP